MPKDVQVFKAERREPSSREFSRGLGSAAESNSKLAVMPLTVLLPKLGEVRRVVNFAEIFAERLQELQARNFAASPAEEDAEQRKRRVLEESMLNQVQQWLSIQSSRE